MIAIPRVDLNLEKTITMMTVIGTLRNMPGNPHTNPQKPRARITTSGLTFIVFPITFGSTIFPAMN
ncbi:hypothetical protein D3C86_1890820 [compost metagenome]